MKEEVSKKAIENDEVQKKCDLEKQMIRKIKATRMFPKDYNEIGKRKFMYFDITCYDNNLHVHKHIDVLSIFGFPKEYQSSINEIVTIDYINKIITIHDKRFYEKMKKWGNDNKYTKLVKNWNGASLKSCKEGDMR